ncbi:Hsp20/alpha crystallin family protein [Falsibacillus albus]|uniref:Hsp20/alpha crystallin family protein n=1 Tax=Falsibacillus albus TaxID=2478915 RepID=A0A3L7JYM1_9BACI|nr:Hsp20/alpha crystallin family protein [Falsibacillus albus]RLQ95395.1 Hsp20/alpha crystallin family protein [Falsibacillus albus]
MDMEKLKQWLDLTKQYQSENFWHQVFDQSTASDELFGAFPQSADQKREVFQGNSTFPLCDVYEKDDLFIIEVEVPGLKKDQIEITYEEKYILIRSAFRNFQPSIRYHKKERLNKAFEKKIFLPYEMKAHSIKSSIQNGVLTIQCPFQRHQNKMSIQIDEVEEP